ncbi:hypothetical protein AQPE_1022 [Aquipluma nitroreducens]|uniref:Uncharacterized protein n=1 Tax=Aquipluma nitroreducens TaxID=2010828 RepID=A0A5K7S5W3_9BACT|nr:hypothetical protein AQPE_1022 [Aquipluma nitroreducens]
MFYDTKCFLFLSFGIYPACRNIEYASDKTLKKEEVYN